MNIKVAALASVAKSNNREIFNETTRGLDLRHPEFSLEAFEQIGNEYRLVISDGAVIFGLAAEMDNPEARVIRIEDLGVKKSFVSAHSQLLRYGSDGFVPGFHPVPQNERGTLQTLIGYVRNNYAGVDFGAIPEDGKWYPVVSMPVAGGEDRVVVGRKPIDSHKQDKQDALDLLIDGNVFIANWPKGNNTVGEQLVTWLATVLGNTQAVLDGDDELVAIYNTRYMEAKVSNQLNSQARDILKGKSAAELDEIAAAKSQTLVFATVGGAELVLKTLGDGSPVRFFDANGRYKGEQVWSPKSAYAVQRMEEASKKGWLAQVLYDTATIGA